MSNRAWMPLHIETYMADTLHLSATEHGAYLLLIMRYWKDGGLPGDEGMIRRYARMSVEQWSESRDVLISFFHDGWKHSRIDAELAKADEIIEKRRAAAGARHSRSKSNAHAQQVQSKSTDTGALPRTIDQEKEEPNGSSKKNGVRLSPDWELPDEWRQWAVSRGLPPERCDIEATKIRNWSINAKANGAKKDWFRAWQNWVMDAIDKLPKSRGSPPAKASSSSALADSAARLAQTMRSADEIRSGSSGPGIPALIPHLPVR